MAKYLLPMILGLGLVLTTTVTQEALAKGGGGGGGGHGGGGGGHAGGGHPSGGHPGGGGYYHVGPVYRAPFYGFYGGGFYGGFYYDPWYAYGAPYYYNDGYPLPPANIYVVPGSQSVPQMPPADPLGQTAQVNMTLPQANAKVWIDGNAMTTNGQKRIFTSPTLESGYSYTYRIAATWMDNGQEVRVERVVPVAPGKISNVDFTRVNTVEATPAAQ
jgi:uncharacterized protein (TIGR03000 family)